MPIVPGKYKFKTDLKKLTFPIRSGRPCFRCTASKENSSWSDFSQHHFVSSENDWRVLSELDTEDDILSINRTNSRDVQWWSLTERKENWEKVESARKDEERKEKKARQKRIELEKKTQQLFAPITCEEPIHHNLEVIHLIEGVMKRVCKISMLLCFSETTWEKNIVKKFQQLTGLQFKRESSETPWKRITAGRLNRVHWLRVLRGFVKQEDERGEEENGIFATFFHSFLMHLIC